MSAKSKLRAAKRDLVVDECRPRLTDDRIGSLVQVAARTAVDDQGNSKPVRVAVDRRQFVALLVKDGNEHVAAVPAPKDAHAALRAAVARAKKGLSEVGAELEETNGWRLLWRRLGVTGTEVRYALVVAEPDAMRGSWTGDQAATVSVDANGGDVRVDWVAGNQGYQYLRDAVSSVEERYKAERAYLHSDDVRRWVNTVFSRVHSVSVGGMLHLVAKDGDEHFRTAERALTFAGYQLVLQPIADGTSVSGNAEQGMLSQVARLTREIRDLVKERNNPNKRDVTVETFDRRLEDARVLAARADLFADLIGMARSDIDEAVEGAEGLIREVLKEMVLGI